MIESTSEGGFDGNGEVGGIAVEYQLPGGDLGRLLPPLMHRLSSRWRPGSPSSSRCKPQGAHEGQGSQARTLEHQIYPLVWLRGIWCALLDLQSLGWQGVGGGWLVLVRKRLLTITNRRKSVGQGLGSVGEPYRQT
jgi:hypothetical protein